MGRLGSACQNEGSPSDGRRVDKIPASSLGAEEETVRGEGGRRYQDGSRRLFHPILQQSVLQLFAVKYT